MRFFTADHHFGHARILVHTKRGFKDIREMDEAYIEQWNSQVGAGDTVYHLGDFIAFKGMDTAHKYFSRLNGQIYVVPGNHDDEWVQEYHHIVSKNQTVRTQTGGAIVVLPPITQTRIKGNKVTLCHYPMRSWRASYHGSWHLYGHVHGYIDPWGRSMDVGVDGSGGALYTENDIVEYMKLRADFLDQLEKERTK